MNKKFADAGSFKRMLTKEFKAAGLDKSRDCGSYYSVKGWKHNGYTSGVEYGRTFTYGGKIRFNITHTDLNKLENIKNVLDSLGIPNEFETYYNSSVIKGIRVEISQFIK